MPVVQESPLEKLARDLLSPTTRRDRRSLLAVSLASLVVTELRLIPTRIESLGLTFTVDEQRGGLVLLSLVSVYFLLAFLASAGHDGLEAWRTTRAAAVVNEALTRRLQEAKVRNPHAWHPLLWPGRWLMVTSGVRWFLDFAFPVLLGAFALVRLLVFVARVP